MAQDQITIIQPASSATYPIEIVKREHAAMSDVCAESKKAAEQHAEAEHSPSLAQRMVGALQLQPSADEFDRPLVHDR